jgi:hypothetical protein
MTAVAATRPHAVIGEADHFPIEDSETNCQNGDEVPFRGHMTINVHTTPSFMFKLLFSTHTVVDGEGLIWGDVYHGSSNDVFEINNGVIFPFEETLVHNVNLQSPTAPDMKIHVVAHVTVNANGQWTATVDKLKTNCDPSPI